MKTEHDTPFFARKGGLPPSERERLLQPDVITGSEMLLRTLLLEQVDCVFGYPGGAVLCIYDAMHDSEWFHHVLTRHEQGAIHAADGYARATGKVGVCIATSGPGATNLVTGIATAHLDSIPLVIITGNVATILIGTDAFQEADIIGITMPITKHNITVRSAEEIPLRLREAFHIAGTGRKGPVLVDIPKDVSAQSAPFRYPASVRLRGYDPDALHADRKALRRLAGELGRAERPVLLCGGGMIQSGACETLRLFAARCRLPVATTLMGLGASPADNPLWLGMPGMHGTYAANKALQEADLIVALVTRFDDRVTMRPDRFAPRARIAHVDIDAAELGKIVPTAYPVAAHLQEALDFLLEHVPTGPGRSDWLKQLQRWKAEQPLRYSDGGGSLKPQLVIELISETTQGEAIITTDVGQHQMWAAQFYRFKHPRSMITSGGLGTMGFGFPSAIGAQYGCPDKLVVSINGDGGIQMCAQELALCAIHRLPVKIVILNNRTLGMIRQWQELIYDGRYSHIDLSGSPDFVKLAEAYGVKGLRAASKSEAESVWREALATNGPVLIDFVVDKEELVLPMIPNGKSLDDMILEVNGNV